MSAKDAFRKDGYTVACYTLGYSKCMSAKDVDRMDILYHVLL